MLKHSKLLHGFSPLQGVELLDLPEETCRIPGPFAKVQPGWLLEVALALKLEFCCHIARVNNTWTVGSCTKDGHGVLYRDYIILQGLLKSLDTGSMSFGLTRDVDCCSQEPGACYGLAV